MRRVSTYIPIPFMEVSERLHNVQLRFNVVMCTGNEVVLFRSASVPHYRLKLLIFQEPHLKKLETLQK